MKKIGLWVGLCCWLVCSIANANVFQNKNFIAVQRRLAEHQAVSGQFKQIRRIKLLSKPLVSSGIFKLSKKSGLLWQQRKPFASMLMLTDTKLIQKIGDSPATIFTKAKQPIIFSFTKIFLSVFKGNVQSLREYFSVDFNGNTKKWQLNLHPLHAPLNKAIHEIALSGGDNINKVRILDNQGNKQTIYFTKVHAIT